MEDLSGNLFEEIIQTISEGHRKIVVWEINSVSLKTLGALACNGLLPFVKAIVDTHEQIQGQSFFGLEVISPEKLQEIEFDTLAITSDKHKESAIEEFSRYNIKPIPKVILVGSLNYEFDDPVYYSILEDCAVKSKAGGYPNSLIHLYQALKYVATRNLCGNVAEFGVYKGGTTVFMAKVLKHFGFGGRIYGFDTFAGFPPRQSVLDLYCEKSCEFRDFETVKRYCSQYNIELIPGDICKTYTKLNGIDLVFSFFDTDNYTPTRCALDLCVKQTLPGGILAFDHYFSPNYIKTIGERIAIKQVLQENQFLNLYGTGIFVKI